MLNNIKGAFQIASYKFAKICNKIKIGLLKLKLALIVTNFYHKRQLAYSFFDFVLWRWYFIFPTFNIPHSFCLCAKTS